MRRRAASLLTIPMLLGLTACSTEEVEVEDLEAAVEDELDHFDIDRAEVECPESIAAEIGAEQTCTVEAYEEGEVYTHDAELTVSEVDDEQIHFEIDIPALTGGSSQDEEGGDD